MQLGIGCTYCMLSNEKEKKKIAVLNVQQMDQQVIQAFSTTHFNTNLCCATSLLWPVRSKTTKTRWPQTSHQSTYNTQIPVFKINDASSTTRKQQISTQRWHWLCTAMPTNYANTVPPFLHNSLLALGWCMCVHRQTESGLENPQVMAWQLSKASTVSLFC